VRGERAGSAAPLGPLAGAVPHQASSAPWPPQVCCFFSLLKIVSVFLLWNLIRIQIHIIFAGSPTKPIIPEPLIPQPLIPEPLIGLSL
jgi:hypothetical protein